jgi:hypothetical protein
MNRASIGEPSIWKPHPDYAGEPMMEGQFRDPPTEGDGFERRYSEPELSDSQRTDLLALYDALGSTIYGGLSDAFSAADYQALKNAGLVRSYVPAGCMAPLTKLTVKGRKAAERIRDSDAAAAAAPREDMPVPKDCQARPSPTPHHGAPDAE